MLKRKQNLFGEVKNAMYCAFMNITFSKKEGSISSQQFISISKIKLPASIMYYMYYRW